MKFLKVALLIVVFLLLVRALGRERGTREQKQSDRAVATRLTNPPVPGGNESGGIVRSEAPVSATSEGRSGQPNEYSQEEIAESKAVLRLKEELVTVLNTGESERFARPTDSSRSADEVISDLGRECVQVYIEECGESIRFSPITPCQPRTPD